MKNDFIHLNSHNMEPLTLSAKDTALLVAGRLQETSPNGDMWNALIIDSPTDYYNQKRNDYLLIENQVREVIDGGGTIIGTDVNGNPIQIGGMPSRPRPKGV